MTSHQAVCGRAVAGTSAAALRRGTAPPGTTPSVVFGDVFVDLARREVTRAAAQVHLTPREYELLAELARHAGRVLTHRSLLRTLWGPTFADEMHCLRVQMASLRQPLKESRLSILRRPSPSSVSILQSR